jgi:predicted RNA binding protein with dsRBD fold (UPF0201 family)
MSSAIQLGAGQLPPVASTNPSISVLGTPRETTVKKPVENKTSTVSLPVVAALKDSVAAPVERSFADRKATILKTLEGWEARTKKAIGIPKPCESKSDLSTEKANAFFAGVGRFFTSGFDARKAKEYAQSVALWKIVGYHMTERVRKLITESTDTSSLQKAMRETQLLLHWGKITFFDEHLTAIQDGESSLNREYPAHVHKNPRKFAAIDLAKAKDAIVTEIAQSRPEILKLLKDVDGSLKYYTKQNLDLLENTVKDTKTTQEKLYDLLKSQRALLSVNIEVFKGLKQPKVAEVLEKEVAMMSGKIRFLKYGSALPSVTVPQQKNPEKVSEKVVDKK